MIKSNIEKKCEVLKTPCLVTGKNTGNIYLAIRGKELNSLECILLNNENNTFANVGDIDTISRESLELFTETIRLKNQ